MARCATRRISCENGAWRWGEPVGICRVDSLPFQEAEARIGHTGGLCFPVLSYAAPRFKQRTLPRCEKTFTGARGITSPLIRYCASLVICTTGLLLCVQHVWASDAKDSR